MSYGDAAYGAMWAKFLVWLGIKVSHEHAWTSGENAHACAKCGAIQIKVNDEWRDLKVKASMFEIYVQDGLGCKCDVCTQVTEAIRKVGGTIPDDTNQGKYKPCPRGHKNSPSAKECWVCGAQMRTD
jgi:hypothetical protein